MPTVLITGSSRGIGLALAREYAGRDWCVLATCRVPARASALQELAERRKNVSVHALDVTDAASITALAEALRGTVIDVLYNNAGIGGRHIVFGAIDYSRWQEIMATNLLGPLRMAEAFVEHVSASRQKKIMSISSSLGCIARTTGGNMLYRTSKSALNMAMRSLAKDVAGRGITVGILSPGVVDTDFTADADMPFKIPADVSARGLADICDRYTLARSGSFMRYNGEELPW